MERDTCRPSTLMGKANTGEEAKGTSTHLKPGVRPMACGERDMKGVPETPAFSQGPSSGDIRSRQEGEPEHIFLPVPGGDGSLRPAETEKNRAPGNDTLPAVSRWQAEYAR